MKFRDNKKYRNERVRKEKYRSRDKRENEIGTFTGFFDKQGRNILSGNIVLVYNYYDPELPHVCVVFWDVERNAYSAMRGCWYGEKKLTDPRCYGKVDATLNARKGQKYQNIEVVGSLTGNDRVDAERLTAVYASQGIEFKIAL